MRFMKRLLMGISAVALAGTLLTLVAPKAVHAAVAALVLVTNTPANPVPNADVNAPGEEPFQTQICDTLGSFPGACSGTPGTFTVPSTTSDGLSVKRLVVEQISAQCASLGAVSHPVTTLSFQTNENQVNGTVFPAVISLPLVAGGPPGYISSTTVRAYADPGTSSGWNLGFDGGGSGTGLTCTYTIVGSLITH
jgi:hypothetical protein